MYTEVFFPPLKMLSYQKREIYGCISDIKATDDEGPLLPTLSPRKLHTPSSGLVWLPKVSPAEYPIAKEQRCLSSGSEKAGEPRNRAPCS